MAMRNAQQMPIEAELIKKRREKSAIVLPIIPEDVIFCSIYIYLPARLLLLLRSLSHSSLQMIDNPSFSRTHVALASPHLLFFATKPCSHPCLFTLEINRCFHGHNRVTPLLNFVHGYPFFIIASCNGLLLLGAGRSEAPDPQGIFAVIMNPVTKQCFLLPSPQDGKYSFYGFVFDASSNKYKVVHLLIDEAGVLLCEILTLGPRSERWKRINVPMPICPEAIVGSNYKPIRVGQILYWVDGHSMKWPGIISVFDPLENHIMSLDVGKEEFRQIRPPPKAENLCRILELGGCLALLHFDLISVEIWVLEDYEGQVWVKKHCTMKETLASCLGIHGVSIGFEIIGSLHEGNVIIFGCSKRLYKYDLKHDSFVEIWSHFGYLGQKDQNEWDISSSCIHVDSLERIDN